MFPRLGTVVAGHGGYAVHNPSRTTLHVLLADKSNCIHESDIFTHTGMCSSIPSFRRSDIMIGSHDVSSFEARLRDFPVIPVVGGKNWRGRLSLAQLGTSMVHAMTMSQQGRRRGEKREVLRCYRYFFMAGVVDNKERPTGRYAAVAGQPDGSLGRKLLA